MEYSIREIRSEKQSEPSSETPDVMTSYAVGRWRDALVIRQSGRSAPFKRVRRTNQVIMEFLRRLFPASNTARLEDTWSIAG